MHSQNNRDTALIYSESSYTQSKEALISVCCFNMFFMWELGFLNMALYFASSYVYICCRVVLI
jgi:hypothetical protein